VELCIKEKEERTRCGGHPPPFTGLQLMPCMPCMPASLSLPLAPTRSPIHLQLQLRAPASQPVIPLYHQPTGQEEEEAVETCLPASLQHSH
jgi:hypothetical protein